MTTGRSDRASAHCSLSPEPQPNELFLDDVDYSREALQEAPDRKLVQDEHVWHPASYGQ